MPVAQGHTGAEVVGLPAWSRSPTRALNCREAKQAARPTGQSKKCAQLGICFFLFSAFMRGGAGVRRNKRRNKKKKSSLLGGKRIHPEFSLCLHLRRPASTFAQLGDMLGLSLSGARHGVAASASIFLHSPFAIPITINIFTLP